MWQVLSPQNKKFNFLPPTILSARGSGETQWDLKKTKKLSRLK